MCTRHAFTEGTIQLDTVARWPNFRPNYSEEAPKNYNGKIWQKICNFLEVYQLSFPAKGA
jgi:hypothetical protein